MVRYTLVLCLVVALFTGGCLGVVTGDEPLTFTAEEASVSEGALDETGYQLAESKPIEIEETVSIMDVEREVEITTYISTYERASEVPNEAGDSPAFFMVASTPDVTVAGQSLNPLAQMDQDRLIEEIGDRNDDLENIEKVGSQTVTALGTDVEVGAYEATTEMEGQSVEVMVHVARINHDDDFIIAIGAYPAMLDGEGENIATLVEGLEH